LSDTFTQFIQAHKLKVSHYILQAQLAMVRLNDQALLKNSDNLTLLNDTSVTEDDPL
jgi:hypothetical protein